MKDSDKMNKYYNEYCIKCRNIEICYVAKMLSDSGDEFNKLVLTNCIGYTEI